METKMYDQKMDQSPLERVQNKEGKWNLRNKETKEYVSDIWFDNLGTWSSYQINHHDIFGWDGLIFLETPRKSEGVYPYMVKSTIYNYSSEGKLLSVGENTCGIWGYGYNKKSKCVFVD